MTQMNQLQQSGMDQLQNIVNQTALNTRSISQQLGIIASAVTDLKAHADQTDQKIEDMGNRMTGWEERERINRAQQRRMKHAVVERVNRILGIKVVNGVVAKESLKIAKTYRSAFIRRCYIDAKNKSRMGEPYYETTVRDYEDVMKYIESWVPECSYDGYTGTKAYIKYLNEMRNA